LAKKNKSGRDLHGLLVLDKPLGLSSNHALQRVKRLFNAKKAGHTGTLDPLATGVLVICFGRATKIVDHIMGSTKAYFVVAKLGEQTDTADREGQVIASSNVTDEHRTKIASVVEQFVGDIEQIPPMYSALKKEGVPLYKYAREGKEVERRSRHVRVDSININNIDAYTVAMTVHCSKGTYIRTLIEDIGNKLGCYAHVAELRRLSVGAFGNDMPMHTISELEHYAENSVQSLERTLLPIEAAFKDYPKYEMKNGLLQALEQGVRLKYPCEEKSKFIRIYDSNRIFRGLGSRDSQGLVNFSKQF